MKHWTWLTGLAAAVALGAVTAAAQTPPPDRSRIEFVTLPSADTPLVSIRAMFRAGSIHDPAGKEGLSALTALMIGSGGTANRTYAELVDALYPMAARINVSTDREVTVLYGQVHRETLRDYVALFTEALLQPGFREEDFTRNREQLLAFLTTTLRSANDELLGLEQIQQQIFRDHPYGHASAGTVDGLKNITLDDLRRFYREHYTQANLILGIAGGYPSDFPAAIAKDLTRLPASGGVQPVLPPPPAVKGRRFTLVDKRADSVGIHFGYPLTVTRVDDDFYPLLVANSFLGEHRTFHGRLMQELRGKRGLNYGDYSYIEYWDNPPGTSNPPPNNPRRQQYFSVWVRPVLPDNAVFAVRAAIHEMNQLIQSGITQADFDLTRDFLISYSKLWARSLSDRLGFHMDGRFYGMPYFIDQIEKRLSSMRVDDVNRAIRKYLQTENFVAVMITGDAAALRERLTSGRPSPIEYASPVPPDVKQNDRAIAALPIQPAQIRIVPVEETFIGAGTAGKKP